METGPLLQIMDPMDYTPHFEINHDVYILFMYISHIETETKLPPCFQIHSCENWPCNLFQMSFTEGCLKSSS